MRSVAAALVVALLLVPLTALAGPIYRCRVDGDWRATCCCEEDATCGPSTLASDAMRECSCCNVVRFESRDPSPIVVSPTAHARSGLAAVPGPAHFAGPGRIAAPAPRASFTPPSLPLAASVFLEHCALRL